MIDAHHLLPDEAPNIGCAIAVIIKGHRLGDLGDFFPGQAVIGARRLHADPVKAALVVEEQLRRGAYRRGVERAFVGAGIHSGRQPVFHFVAGEDGIKRQQPVAQGITRDQGHIDRDDIGHSRASAQPYLDLREEIVEADLFRFDLDIGIVRFKLFDECFGGPAERH